MNPVKGSYRRYALVQPRDAQNCTVLAAYQGWRRAWQAKAGGRSYFVDFASYTGGLLVTRVDTPGSPNRLVAYNEMTGKIRWRWQCPDRDPAYFSTATYHGMNDASKNRRLIEVTCRASTVRVNAMTGKRMR